MINKLVSTSEKPSEVLQLLPCTIEYTGEAKVDQFFNSKIEKVPKGEPSYATHSNRERRGDAEDLSLRPGPAVQAKNARGLPR